MPGSEIASSSSRHEFTVSIGMSVVVPADATRHTGPMRRAAPLPPSIRRRMAHEIFALVSVPFFTGAIGYATNWTGVWMLFEPLTFKGIHVPGLSKLIRVMPRKIQQIPGIMSGGIRDLVERTMQRDHPDIWNDLPPRLRERVHQRVEEQLPDIVNAITDELGENIDHLLDVKLMVIRTIEATPELSNRIFRAIGRKELRMIINFGFIFGFTF